MSNLIEFSPYFWEYGQISPLTDLQATSSREYTLPPEQFVTQSLTPNELYNKFLLGGQQCIETLKAYIEAGNFATLHDLYNTIINRLGTSRFTSFLALQGSEIILYRWFNGIFNCTCSQEKNIAKVTDLLIEHFKRSPVRLTAYLLARRTAISKPKGINPLKWKTYQAEIDFYEREFKIYCHDELLASFAMMAWSETKDYTLFRNWSRIPQNCIRYLLYTECGAFVYEVDDFFTSKDHEILTEGCICYLVSRKRKISEWYQAASIISTFKVSFPDHDLADQLFDECLMRYGHPLQHQPSGLKDFLDAFQHVGNSEEKLALFFNALQNGHALQEIVTALQDGVFGTVLDKETFGSLTDDEKEAHLTYFVVTRQREGLPICKSILKTFQKNPSNQALAKQVILALRMMRELPSYISIPVLERILFLLWHENSDIAIAAIEALEASHLIQHNARVKMVLFAKLREPHYDMRLKIGIIRTLGLLSLSYDEILDQLIVSYLIDILPYEPKDVRIEIALLFAQIRNRKALHAASQVVMSSDWDDFDDQYLKDREIYLGTHASAKHRIFIGMPEFTWSRSSLSALILDRLISLFPTMQRDSRDIAESIVKGDSAEISREQFFNACTSLGLTVDDLDTIYEFANGLSQLAQTEVRYYPCRLEYPVTTPLYRGINCRKGEKLFERALTDILSHGCVAGDLSCLGSTYDCGTWFKQGIAFCSHDLETVFENYGSNENENAAIIKVDPNYVNQELGGYRARWEYEGNFNTALCRGIPREAITAIYLPKKFKDDLQALANTKVPLDELKKSLRTSLFQSCEKTKLAILRKRLNDRINLFSSSRRFFDKIRFIDPKNKSFAIQTTAASDDSVKCLLVTKFIMQHFLSINNLHSDPIIGLDTEIRQKVYGTSPSKRAHSEKLCSLLRRKELEPTDLMQALEQFPYDFKELANFPAGHGTKEDETAVNLFEHTLEVIFGRFGGFGLKDDLLLQSRSPTSTRLILRFAALFHDVGKRVTYSIKHIDESCKIARKALTPFVETGDLESDELDLITSIILSNNIFGTYFTSNRPDAFEKLEKHFWYAHEACSEQELQTSIASEDYLLLLFSLWIADASTLKAVNETHREIYYYLFQNMTTIDLERIKAAKHAILASSEEGS